MCSSDLVLRMSYYCRKVSSSGHFRIAGNSYSACDHLCKLYLGKIAVSPVPVPEYGVGACRSTIYFNAESCSAALAVIDVRAAVLISV